MFVALRFSHVTHHGRLETHVLILSFSSTVLDMQLGGAAHEAQAQLVNLYIDRQLCEVDRRELEAPPIQKTDGPWVYQREEEILNLPRVGSVLRFRLSIFCLSTCLSFAMMLTDFRLMYNSQLLLTDTWDDERVTPKMVSTCRSTSSSRNPLKPFKAEGWAIWRDEFKKKVIHQPTSIPVLLYKQLTHTPSDVLFNLQPYLMSSTPGSTVSFEVDVTQGLVKLSYLRSATFNLGMARCWMNDDEKHGVDLDGYWTSLTNIGQ